MAHLGNTVVNGALRVLGGEYVDTINGVTVGNSPKFTDTTYSAGSNITQSGTQFSLTKANVTGALGYTPPTTNTTYSNVSTSAAGLAPKVTDTGKFLKGDGTWATPTNTTYSNVSSASAGLAPKGAAVSSQSQSTKFLREDGSWAKPSYTTNTNTTYTFANGTNGFTVTPSGGTAQTVTVTPSITNNVTGSGTSGYIAKFNGGNTITNGPAIGSDTTKYLRNDGTWVKPPNDNTWTAMVGATSAANGSVGYVNATPPKDGYNTKYLRADGTWTVPPDNNTTYSNVSTSAAGLAPKVTSTSKFLKGDGTWATPTNTTYSNVSTSAAGLAPKVTNTANFLKGDGTWATPTNTWTAMVGATSAANGSVGYVNAVPPKSGYNTAFLRADGTWDIPGVKQSDNTTGLNDYDVLFSGKQTGSGDYYSSTYKSSNFKYNPSTGKLTVSKINLTGALSLANNTQNNIGDDCKLGDCNESGCIGIQGINGNTGIIFKPYQGSTSNTISIDGNGNINVTGQLQNEGHSVQRCQNTGPQYCASNGNGGYCKIATVQITSPWQDYEFVFTITQRNRGLTHLFVSFQGTESTDPPLGEFKTDNNSGAFYIKKTTTSTQEIYMSFSQAQASCTVHEVIGCGEILNTSNITMNMTQVSSLPSDAQQAQAATYEVDELQSSGQRNLKIFSGGTNRTINFYTIADGDSYGASLYAGSYSRLSSKKTKENIAPLSDNEAKKILNVEVVNFDYKKEYGGEKNCKGVIAEDVNKIIPYVTEMNENNDDPTAFPGVDYSKFVPYLIKMIQIQQEEINDLKERIEILENK